MNKEELFQALSFLNVEHNSLMSLEKLNEIYENEKSRIQNADNYKAEREKLILAMLGLEHLGMLAPGETGKHTYNNATNVELKNIVVSIIRNQQAYFQNQLKHEV